MAVVLPAPQGQYLGLVKDIFPRMVTLDHLIHSVVVLIEIWAGSSLYEVVGNILYYKSILMFTHRSYHPTTMLDHLIHSVVVLIEIWAGSCLYHVNFGIWFGLWIQGRFLLCYGRGMV